MLVRCRLRVVGILVVLVGLYLKFIVIACHKHGIAQLIADGTAVFGIEVVQRVVPVIVTALIRLFTESQSFIHSEHWRRMVVGNIFRLIFVFPLCFLRDDFLARHGVLRLGFAIQRVGRSQLELTQVNGTAFTDHDIAVGHQRLGTHLITDRRQHGRELTRQGIGLNVNLLTLLHRTESAIRTAPYAGGVAGHLHPLLVEVVGKGGAVHRLLRVHIVTVVGGSQRHRHTPDVVL